MTHRNNKRNNRRNRQRNNKTELSPFASMLFGALLGKGTEMIAEKMAEAKKTPDVHAEGITNKDINNINNGNATLSKLRIPADGSAVDHSTTFSQLTGNDIIRRNQGKVRTGRQEDTQASIL